MTVIFVVYPRSTQAHFNTSTPTWLNQKGYTTMLKSITKDDCYLCCIPRSTQAHLNARTPTWLNQKGYITMLKSLTKDDWYLCCASQEHSGTFHCEDSYLTEPERIYSNASIVKYDYLCCVSQENSGTFQC